MDEFRDENMSIEVESEMRSSTQFIFDSLPDGATVMSLRFKSVDEADEFMFDYGSMAGFNIRKCHKKYGKDGIVKNREWVCAKAGLRRRSTTVFNLKRRPKSETRCDCPARFKLAYETQSGMYKITGFFPDHNHQLETPVTSKVLKCNRYLSTYAKNFIHVMKESGNKPCKSMDLIEHLAGGPGNLPFRRKDAYNHLYREKMERFRDGDANAALSFLQGMQMKDKDLVFDYEVDDEKALKMLFWTDGRSRNEYNLFGDVLVFDSTYKTNTYRFPLVIFSGLNNHMGTCIFGAGLLFNETADSYRWLLRSFLKAMNGKVPISVLTDQDASMLAAVKSEIPNARHRICSWHIERNAAGNLHLPLFTSGLGALLRKNHSISDFEREWTVLVEKHGVSNHTWVLETYANKEMWSEAYFRGHFMGRMRTTQRAESVNALFKDSGDEGFNITEVLKQYHNIVGKLRTRFSENQSDCETSTHAVRPSPLEKLEKHAAQFYTKKAFNIVQDEIVKEQGLILEEASNPMDGLYQFKFGKYGNDSRKRYVIIDWRTNLFKCDCQMLESDGLPCRHIISSLKCLQETHFPDACLNPIWSVRIGSTLRKRFPNPMAFQDPQRKRFAKVHMECVNVCEQSHHSDAAASKSVQQLRVIASEAEKQHKANSVTDGLCSNQPHGDREIRKSSFDVRDPKRIRTKGAPPGLKHQKCGHCGEQGHKVTTCKKKKRAESFPGVDDRAKADAYASDMNVGEEMHKGENSQEDTEMLV